MDPQPPDTASPDDAVDTGPQVDPAADRRPPAHEPGSTLPGTGGAATTVPLEVGSNGEVNPAASTDAATVAEAAATHPASDPAADDRHARSRQADEQTAVTHQAPADDR